MVAAGMIVPESQRGMAGNDVAIRTEAFVTQIFMSVSAAVTQSDAGCNQLRCSEQGNKPQHRMGCWEGLMKGLQLAAAHMQCSTLG